MKVCMYFLSVNDRKIMITLLLYFWWRFFVSHFVDRISSCKPNIQLSSSVDSRLTPIVLVVHFHRWSRLPASGKGLACSWFVMLVLFIMRYNHLFFCCCCCRFFVQLSIFCFSSLSENTGIEFHTITWLDRLPKSFFESIYLLLECTLHVDYCLTHPTDSSRFRQEHGTAGHLPHNFHWLGFNSWGIGYLIVSTPCKLFVITVNHFFLKHCVHQITQNFA